MSLLLYCDKCSRAFEAHRQRKPAYCSAACRVSKHRASHKARVDSARANTEEAWTEARKAWANNEEARTEARKAWAKVDELYSRPFLGLY